MYTSFCSFLTVCFSLLLVSLTAQSAADISLEIPFNDTTQIEFREGGPEYGMIIRYNGNDNINGLEIIPKTPNFSGPVPPSLVVNREDGWVSAGRGGADGIHLLRLNAERSWAFSQYGSGASTALRLANVSESNDNKNFLIDTEGGVGIRDNLPVHQLSLGSSLAYTKLALFESGDNSSSYGLGVTSGRFHFNLGNSLARYVFRNGPSSTAPIIFEIQGSGNILAPGLEDFGSGAPMIYSTSGGEIGFNTSSRRFKTNIKTLEEDWTKLFKIRPVIYGRHATPDVPEIGYIAEELDSLGFEHLVGYDQEGLPLYVSYDKLVIYLTEIVKLQQIDLMNQKEEIGKLNQALEQIKLLSVELDSLKVLIGESHSSLTNE